MVLLPPRCRNGRDPPPLVPLPPRPQVVDGRARPHRERAGVDASTLVTPKDVAELAVSIDTGALADRPARQVLEGVIAGEGTPSEVVQSRGLEVVSDDTALIAAIDEALAAQPDVLEKIRDGKVQAAGDDSLRRATRRLERRVVTVPGRLVRDIFGVRLGRPSIECRKCSEHLFRQIADALDLSSSRNIQLLQALIDGSRSERVPSPRLNHVVGADLWVVARTILEDLKLEWRLIISVYRMNYVGEWERV